MTSINIGGDEVSAITIDGDDVSEVTIDGDVIFTDSVTSGTVIDNFEDQNLSEYSGDTGDFSFVTSPVQQGTYALRDDGGSGGSTIFSTSGLSTYFPKGNTAEIYIRFATSGFTRILFGLTDSNNYYQATVSQNNNNLILHEVSAGSPDFLAQDSDAVIDTGIWLKLVIEWDDGTLGGGDNDITLRLYDDSDTLIGECSENDSTHEDAEGIGIIGEDAGTSGAHIYYDNFTIQ